MYTGLNPFYLFGHASALLLPTDTLEYCSATQFLRTLLLGSIAAGGVFAYALFNSDLPQQGPLGTGPAVSYETGSAVKALSMCCPNTRVQCISTCSYIHRQLKYAIVAFFGCPGALASRAQRCMIWLVPPPLSICLVHVTIQET